MNLFKNLFHKKEEPIKNYSDFWDWFLKNEKTFYKTVKNHKNIEKDFFDKLTPKLLEIKDGFYFLTGMYDYNTAELILTAESNPKNIAFIEELVAAAPVINGWKITALKNGMDIENNTIEMNDYSFNNENISFYSNDYLEYPDEIDIHVVHNELNEQNKDVVVNGTYIYLDNLLGELEFLNNIDNIKVIGKEEANKELVSIDKIKAFLNWRQKEFIEKYEGVRYDTDNDEYQVLEADLKSGNKILAVINSTLLDWDSKASHPWIASISFKFDGEGNNGMPYSEDYELLNEIEEKILEELKDIDGYLNIGRQTAEGEREVYFACKDFRKPSKILYQIEQEYNKTFEISYEIYKDKYWQSFERFLTN